MSDLIQVQHGVPPWLPSADARELVVLDEYNIPLAGIVEQHGVPYLFVCAAGEEAQVNVWLYAHLSSEDIATLRDARGRALVPAMAKCLRHRLIVAALASNDVIVSSTAFQTQDESPGAMVRRYLRLEEVRLRQMQDRVAALHRDKTLDPEQETLELAF